MRRTGLITGGAQGIGRGIAVDLIAHGWAVAVLDKDAEALEEMAAAHAPDSLLTLPADVGNETRVRRAFLRFDTWRKRHRHAAGLHLLVNNAGIADAHTGPIERLALREWRRRLDSHLTGAFLCTKHAAPRLRRAGAASIVNMASTRALQSEPDSEAYAAAKGALLGLTHALAISLGPAVRCNAICPGWIETAAYKKRSARSTPRHRRIDETQHPAGRIGTPQDIADAVRYFADAPFLTGQALVIDGGMTRKMIYA